MTVVLPDFTRWIWLSEEARATWSLRISAIARAWAQVEMASVPAGVRESVMMFPSVELLPRAFREAAEHGLLLMPLSLEGAEDSAYSATSKEYKAGGPGKYRCVMTRPELAGRWLMAYQDNDEIAIGALLGYPSCCTEFYRRVWIKERCTDTTAAMAEAGTAGPPESNILLRWLNVRLVPHLPCNFNCEKTVQLGRELGALWERMEFGQELAWAREMLSWPMEWSALHGVAEIRTPILTIMTRTDWTPDEHVVRREGEQYPAEGANGLRFPYRIVKDKATGVPSFARSVTPVWELNGFGSAAAMEQAHAVLLKVLQDVPVGALLDLGCGSGRLLEWAKAKGWNVAGVESDSVRAGAATIPVRRGDMFDLVTWNGAWDVVLMMPGRILERNYRPAYFIDALRMRAHRILLYAYGDWLDGRGIKMLAEQAGLGTHDVEVARGPGVEAMLIRTADIPTSAELVAR